jgi:hypothetical protein
MHPGPTLHVQPAIDSVRIASPSAPSLPAANAPGFWPGAAPPRHVYPFVLRPISSLRKTMCILVTHSGVATLCWLIAQSDPAYRTSPRLAQQHCSSGSCVPASPARRAREAICARSISQLRATALQLRCPSRADCLAPCAVRPSRQLCASRSVSFLRRFISISRSYKLTSMLDSLLKSLCRLS